jgi:hypothetical protein
MNTKRPAINWGLVLTACCSTTGFFGRRLVSLSLAKVAAASGRTADRGLRPTVSFFGADRTIGTIAPAGENYMDRTKLCLCMLIEPQKGSQERATPRDEYQT